MMFADGSSECSRSLMYFRKSIRYDFGYYNLCQNVKRGEHSHFDDIELRDESKMNSFRPEFNFYNETPGFFFSNDFAASYSMIKVNSGSHRINAMNSMDYELGKVNSGSYRINALNSMDYKFGQERAFKISLDAYFQYMSRKHESTNNIERCYEDDLSITGDLFIGKSNGRIVDSAVYNTALQVVDFLNLTLSANLTEKDVDAVCEYLANRPKYNYIEILNLVNIDDNARLNQHEIFKMNSIMTSVAHVRNSGKEASLGLFCEYSRLEDDMVEQEYHGLNVRSRNVEETFYGIKLNIEKHIKLNSILDAGGFIEGRTGMALDTSSENNDTVIAFRVLGGVSLFHESFRGISSEIATIFTYYGNADNACKISRSNINLVYSWNTILDFYVSAIYNAVIYEGDPVYTISSFEVLEDENEFSAVSGIKYKL